MDRLHDKLLKYQSTLNENGFQFVPAIFSHTIQIHEEIKMFIKEQMRQQLIYSEAEAKRSGINS